MITGHPLEKIINGPAHHTLHHLYFNVNYGQYFTWADRAGGSYRQPLKELDPMLEVQAADEKRTRHQQQQQRKDESTSASVEEHEHAVEDGVVRKRTNAEQST